jgi:hypothetical protein
VALDLRAHLDRCAELVAFLHRGAIRSRIELDLRSHRRRTPVPAGRAAFELGVVPREQPALEPGRPGSSLVRRLLAPSRGAGALG